MNENLHIRIDQETKKILEDLHKKFKISKSSIIRMAIMKLDKENQ